MTYLHAQPFELRYSDSFVFFVFFKLQGQTLFEKNHFYSDYLKWILQQRILKIQKPHLFQDIRILGVKNHDLT